MGNSFEYISYTCVLFSYSQGRAESGGIAFAPVKKKFAPVKKTNFSLNNKNAHQR